MTVANTFYNGPSLSLAAGTYFVSGTITVTAPTQVKIEQRVTAKFYNGTTTWASSESETSPATSNFNAVTTISLHAIITVGTLTTVYFGAAALQASSIIVATVPDNGTNATNTASGMVALKIA